MADADTCPPPPRAAGQHKPALHAGSAIPRAAGQHKPAHHAGSAIPRAAGQKQPVLHATSASPRGAARSRPHPPKKLPGRCAGHPPGPPPPRPASARVSPNSRLASVGEAPASTPRTSLRRDGVYSASSLPESPLSVTFVPLDGSPFRLDTLVPVCSIALGRWHQLVAHSAAARFVAPTINC